MHDQKRLEEDLRLQLTEYLEFTPEDFAEMPALRHTKPEILREVLNIIEEARAAEKRRIHGARLEASDEVCGKYNDELDQARKAVDRERQQIASLRQAQDSLAMDQLHFWRRQAQLNVAATHLTIKLKEVERRQKAAVTAARNAERRDLEKARECIWQEGTAFDGKKIKRWPIEALYEVALKFCMALADALHRPARVQAAGGQRVVREKVKTLGRAVAKMGRGVYKNKVDLAARPTRRRPRARSTAVRPSC